jgi:hypothetical protein
MLSRRWRDPAAWRTTVDVVAILLALALPWSTSLVSIFGVVLIITMVPFLDVEAFVASLKRPICLAPIALFVLALVGTLWSDAAWGVRFYAVGPAAKLLVLPALFYHFERSERGTWVFVAFLGSCALMVVASTIVAFDPALALKPHADRGIFVKNYIDQGQEFSLCAVALAYPLANLAGLRRWLSALLLLALYPIFLMVSMSLRPAPLIYVSLFALPSPPILDNYRTALLDLIPALLRTLFVTATSIAGILALASGSVKAQGRRSPAARWRAGSRG